MTRSILQFEGSEINTILAALRFYQSKGMCNPANRSQEIHDIACCEGDTGLNEAEVDALCEKVNLGHLNGLVVHFPGLENNRHWHNFGKGGIVYDGQIGEVEDIQHFRQIVEENPLDTFVLLMPNGEAKLYE